MAEPLTYGQIISSNTPAFNANLNKVLEAINSGALSPSEFNANYSQYFGYKIKPVYGKLGQPLGFTYQNVAQNVTTNPINSNVTTVNRGNLTTPINTTVDAATNTVRSGRVLPPSGAPSTWSYVANSVASPIIAAGIGISLGKTIDSTLYNLNPSFWDANGMSALNPETWNAITTGIDYSDPITGTAASLMNMIFGLDPEANEATAYIDENAYALMAQYLYSQGVFNESYVTTNPDELDIDGLTAPFNTAYTTRMVSKAKGFGGYWILETTTPVYMILTLTLPSTNYKLAHGYLASTEPFSYGFTQNTDPSASVTIDKYSVAITVQGRTIHRASISGIGGDSYSTIPLYYVDSNATMTQQNNICYVLANDTSASGGVQGIGTQPNAQTPDTTGWNDPTTILPSLQQQYPQVFGNPVPITTVNPDGTETTRNYVPIPLPNARDNTDTQPTSGTQTQPDIKINPSTTPQPIIDLLTKTIQQPETEPFNPVSPVPPNPIDTGDNEEPVTPMPTGNATALWSIYHPTQSQINSFGAWLWSSDFIEQLKKIFNNPMESIIGLHKVYATPIDAGISTIVVGYLDSEVPSAYITQQYVTIDCGTVDINETFGNVFDYSPYTVIKLYLPFVGIVELDPSEVMRSSINIKYGVDVLTGACLAKVRVKRDGNSATLYQFAGNCAVQYPLSMGSYMGIVASIVGVAGSVAATVASGGSAAPLALGALGAAFNAKTNVQNSGSFTGNAGAMGGKKPYLIIERPQTKLADSQQAFIGQPTNEYKRLGNYSGFVKCRDAHITNVSATDDELKEIQSYLVNGVLV